MKRLYTVSMTLAVDDENRQAVIEAARKRYADGGGSSEAEEAVQSIDDALIELIYGDKTFEISGLELREMTCDAEESSAIERIEEPGDLAQAQIPREESETQPSASDLDEYETSVYLCRWPNGDFSIVTAGTRREAIIALDEWAAAHPTQLHGLDSFMADFSLTDEGEIVLNRFGEAADDAIWDLCYPELIEVLTSEDVTDAKGGFKAAGRERVRQAVQHERTRLWENQPDDEPSTELGKTIAGQMGMSAVVADHYVDDIAKRILESGDEDEGPVN